MLTSINKTPIWQHLVISLLLMLFPLLHINASSQLKASNSSKHFEFINIDNPSINTIGAIYSMHQDPRGFLWLGGEHGLIRFDGHNTKLYQWRADDETSLCTNGVGDLLHDHQGNFWVASAFGINRYQPETDNFKCYSHKTNDPNSVLGGYIYGMHLDRFENLWISSDSGLSRYNFEEDHFENSNPIVESTYIQNTMFLFGDIKLSKIGDFYEDKDGIAWMQCALHEPSYGGVCRFDIPKTMNLISAGTTLQEAVNQSFKYYPVTGLPDGPSGHEVPKILEDRNKHLWMITEEFGLNLFDRKSETFLHFRHSSENPTSLAHNRLQSIFEDRQGNLWIGGSKNGLNRLSDLSTNKEGILVPSFDRFGRNLDYPGSLQTDSVTTIFEGSNTGLWFGHYPVGASMLNEYGPSFQNFKHESSKLNTLSSSEITDISEDADQRLWVATLDGLNIVDPKTGVVTEFMHDPENRSSIPSSRLRSVLYDSKGNLWVGTEFNGLYRYDLKSGQYYEYLTDPRRHSRSISIIYEDSQGVIWVGAELGGGLHRYEEESDDFIQYEHDIQNPFSIPNGNISDLLETRDGNFWIATGGRLSMMDRESATFHNIEEIGGNRLSQFRHFSTLLEAQSGDIWAGLETRGLIVLRGEKGAYRVKVYGLEDGLPSMDVGAILEDNNGNIWVGTRNGLTQFDPKEEHFRTYTTDHGLPSNLFDLNAAAKTSSGKLAFGSLGGMTIFDPESLFQNNEPPPVVITELKLFNRPVNFSQENSPLNKPIDLTRSLTLTHKHQVFTLEFSALNYRLPHMNQFAYKLEGFDQDWTYIGNNRSATYTNLNPGHYIFRVKASNNEGVWNETGTSLKIQILPPWWRTWWAYSLYICLVLSMIAKVIHIQYRKRKMAEEQNRILEIKVTERTKELRQKHHDIRSMLSNMQQGLFTIEDGGLIHPEYSSHLENIFEVSDIAKQDAIRLLFSRSKLGADDLDQVAAAVDAIVDRDEFNFDMNQHLLITEYDIYFDEHEKTRTKNLELVWNPIIEDDSIVSKLMVTVRDRTLIKQLESEAESKQRELDIVGQILNILSDKFLSFVEASIYLLDECYESIEEIENDQAESQIGAAIAFSLRNLHTIKGNARTFNLSYISNAAHESETSLIRIRRNDTIDIASLSIFLDEVKRVIEEYSNVYHNVLAKVANGSEQAMQGGVWLEDESVERIFNLIAENQLKSIEEVLYRATSKNLEEVLSDLLKSLPSIANQLNKEIPEVRIEAEHILIKKEAFDLLTNTFSHILRNSLDHGIESRVEREESGKNPTGQIQILASLETANSSSPGLRIVIRDDGRGLNVAALFAKGVEQQLWSNNDERNNQACADLIFHSGVSTKEEVTDISGRGVGMDAVKQFLLGQGCEIELHIADDNLSDNADFLPFETIISLPSNLFVVLD